MVSVSRSGCSVRDQILLCLKSDIHAVLSAAFVRNTEDTKTVDDFVAPLDNLALWSSLYHGQSAPFVPDDMEAFGYNQPGVRKAAWAFAQVLLRTCKCKSRFYRMSLSSDLTSSATAVARLHPWQCDAAFGMGGT